MANLAGLKVIPFKGTFFDAPAFEAKIKSMTDSYHKEVYDAYQRTVRTWKHKPGGMQFKTKSSFFIIIASDIYSWIDDGAKGTTIWPKNQGGMLVFREGKRPKTQTGILGSGPGYAGKRPPKSHLWVNWPGIKARNFTDTIVLRLVPRIDRDYDRLRYSVSQI